MERKNFSLIVLFLLSSFSLRAADYKTEIYKAYISSNMIEWKRVMDNMNLQKEKNNEFILELINYQYGYIGWCISTKRYDEAEKHIEQAQKNTEILRKSNYKLSMINSYEAALLGFRISMNKFKAPFYGPKSVEHAKTAVLLDANNPYGYLQLGNSEYYMPSTFGGSKTEALEYYLKAITLMESNPSQIKNDWNYLGLLTQVALTYEKLEQYDLALKQYQKILKIEPSYQWVKDDLYPKFLKKTGDNK